MNSVTAAFAMLVGSGVLYTASTAFTMRTFHKEPARGSLARYIPFKRAERGYLTCLNGTSVALYRLHGTGEATLSPEEQALLAKQRAAALDPLLDAGCILRLHAIREPSSLHEHAEYPSMFLQKVHDKWMSQFAEVFDTRRFLQIEFPRHLPRWRADNLCAETEARLGNFSPERITGSDLIRWYGDRLDPIYGGITASQETLTDLATALAPSGISADRHSGIITIRSGSQDLVIQQVSVEGWTENDGPEIIDGLLELPLRLEVTAVLKPINKAMAAEWVERKRKLLQGDRENELINKELGAVLDQVQAGRVTPVKTQISVTIISNQKKISEAVGFVYAHLAQKGIKPVTEHAAAAYLWFARFPGHPTQVRARPLRTENIGRLWRWVKHPEGFQHNDWGDGPVRLFPTADRTAYRFTWHVSPNPQEVGHTVVYAPTRGGKTTLLLHLTGGSLRYPGVRAFIFDRNLSTRVYVEAAGGLYLNPHDTKQLTLNPFQGPETRAERDFLIQFLGQLAGRDDTEAKNAYSEIVSDIFRLPREKRSLAAVFETSVPSGLKDDLRRWVDMDGLGALINGRRDTLSLTGQKLVAFDFTQVMGDPHQAAALTTYLMHRIRQVSIDEESPHLVYLEEVAPMLKDPVFSRSVEVLLREHAKLRGVIAMVFQEVGAALKGPIGETIRTNCRRMIFLPNPSAKADDWASIGLSDDEWAFLKGDHAVNKRLVRPIMTKTDDETVFFDADLSSLDELLPFYRGGSQPVADMHRSIKKWGSEWQDHYGGK